MIDSAFSFIVNIALYVLSMMGNIWTAVGFTSSIVCGLVAVVMFIRRFNLLSVGSDSAKGKKSQKEDDA